MKLRFTFLRTVMLLFLLSLFLLMPVMPAGNIAAQDGKSSSTRKPSKKQAPATVPASKPNPSAPKGSPEEAANKKPETVVSNLRLTAAENAAKGDELFLKKDYAAAEPYYRDALALEPENAVYNYSLGATLGWLRKYADAEPYLVKSVTLWPGNAALRKDLGTTLYMQRKYPEAEQQYRAAVRLEPDKPVYHSTVGLVLYYHGKYTEAETFFREALRLEPGNTEYQTSLTAAQSALKAAEKLNPDAAMHNSRGNVLFDEAKYAEAEAAYREALRLDPQSADYKNNLARASANQQKALEKARPKP